MEELDQVILNFDESNLAYINGILAIVMFAVSLEIKMEDFQELFQRPKSILVGLSSQYLLLPLATLAIVEFIPLHASIALGLFLVAACPGGNTSNFFSLMAKGNIALSVSLTAIATVVSGFMIPLSFLFWAGCSSKVTALLSQVEVDFWGMMITTFWLLIVPLLSGMATRYFKPDWADKLSKPLKIFSIIIFFLLVILALAANMEEFSRLFHFVFWIALLHNGSILLLGYVWSSIWKVPLNDKKSITIETGIQNTGIGLVLAFNYFDGLGGLQIMVAWWGIWHLISGGIVSYIFSRMKPG